MSTYMGLTGLRLKLVYFQARLLEKVSAIVMARRMSMMALVSTAFAGSLLFVPGLLPTTAPTQKGLRGGEQADLMPVAGESSALGLLPGLFGGAVLGLLLSLATASPVMAEEAAAAPKELTDEEVLAKGCDIRVDCKTKEQQFRWAKAYYRKYNRDSDGKDPKYSASSTGGGIYRKFKIDQFIEPSGIVSTTDGTYPIRPEAVAFKPIWDEYNKKLIERVEKVYGISDEPIRWNGDYYDNKLSPYKPTLGWYNK